MLTKRDKLLVRPWIDQRYQNHRRKVQSAGVAIDIRPPTAHPHVTIKLKKIQKECERQEAIEKENIRLLQKLGSIMTTKRIENFWTCPRPNFLKREYIFNIRPKTSKATEPEDFHEKYESIENQRGFSSRRCSVCSGRPIKRNQVIPEPRVPFPPVKQTINRKLLDESKIPHKCCKFCC